MHILAVMVLHKYASCYKGTDDEISKSGFFRGPTPHTFAHRHGVHPFFLRSFVQKCANNNISGPPGGMNKHVT